MFNSFLFDDVCSALEAKVDFEVYMKYVCSALERLAPGDCRWYFSNSGFIMVDVGVSDVDEYLEFVEGLVGCSYCYLGDGGDCLTLMFSLSSLRDCLGDGGF